jgi:hypothetical protein
LRALLQKTRAPSAYYCRRNQHKQDGNHYNYNPVDPFWAFWFFFFRQYAILLACALPKLWILMEKGKTKN